MERSAVASLTALGPVLAAFALLPFGFLIKSREIQLVFVDALVIECFLMLMGMSGFYRWLDRGEDRRFQAFLPRAKAHSGWWFIRDADLRATIIHADEFGTLRGAALLEPLDFCRDDHHEVILAEIRRLHELARGSDQVASQYRAQAMRLEGLESQLIPA